MIGKIFPYLTQLQIYQLGEYKASKLFKWITKNFFKRTLENKKKLVFTQKAKLILALALLFDLLVIVFLTNSNGLVGLIIGLLLSTQPYIFLILSGMVISPIVNLETTRIKNRTSKKLESLRNLKVVGITGSYGKTSVKEFLYNILKEEYSVLKTPESYNTVLGISKVVDLELDDSYEYFICEMGAYKKGDIKEIAQMVKPRFAILTGINEQHLESFGSIENTTKAKFELIEEVPQEGFAVVNIDNDHVKSTYQNYDKKFLTYGINDEKNTIKNVETSENGTTFDLLLDGKSYSSETRLLGMSNLSNILAASVMANALGMDPQKIAQAISNLTSVPHRQEFKKLKNSLLIDDSFNSNVTGFKEAVGLLGSFGNHKKVLVTPGIVDLGDKTLEIHKSLGELVDSVADYIFLVGKSERTEGLYEGITDKKKVKYLGSIKEFWGELDSLGLNIPVVLIENDLPDNY